MIVIQGKIPRKVNVACSGGVDSMAIVDFLSRRHEVTLLFFDHGTQTSADALAFLKKYALKKRIPIRVGVITKPREPQESQEEYWRNQRYEFFSTFEDDVITCHHLDDCAETWIWSCLNGEGKIIPYRNGNVIRPFRLNRKETFVGWCNRHHVKWIEDKSNDDTKYMRNFIRHELMPKALVVNQGLHKVIMKKIQNNTVDIG
jgi:tRNA(Ile)-lysidine synthase